MKNVKHDRSIKKLMSKLPFGFEALFPALIALALFAAITDVLYSGGRRENLAAEGEKYLIERSLKKSLEPAIHQGKVVTISLTDADLARYQVAPSHLVKDANLEVYARLLKVITSSEANQPELVVLSWLSSAHPTTADYWQPLSETLAAAKRPQDIFIAYPIAEISSVPRELREKYNFKEGEDCIYEVNSFCSYNPAWRNWVIQSLAERLWPEPAPNHISNNLPHVLPNFLLNLPLKASIPDFSFHEIFEKPELLKLLKGSIVFIGNATSQSIQFRENKSVLRRTFSVENSDGTTLLADGTPLHVFWAQIAQMFVDQKTVAVAPLSVNLSILLLLGVAILMVLFRLGSAAGLAFFLTYAALFPLVNDFGVSRYKVYVPMFDVTYGGFLVFLFSTFGFLSYNNLKTWRLQARRRLFESTADLKGNFVSLISHNLNTPIAKLQGLIDVMLSNKQFSADEGLLKGCRVLVAKLLLCVRTVLLTTSLEQQSLSSTGSKLSALLKEYEDSVSSILKRLSIQTTVFVDEEESLFTTFNIDPKIFGHILGAMATTAAGIRASDIRLGISVVSSESFDDNTLLIAATTALHGGFSRLEQLLTHFKLNSTAIIAGEDDFLLQSLVRFMTTAGKVYRGQVELTKEVNLLRLTFRLNSRVDEFASTLLTPQASSNQPS